MKKKIFFYVFPVVTLSFLIFCSFSNINADDRLHEAVKASGEGDVNGIIINCGNIVSGDADAVTMAKAYSLLAIGYTLQAGDDTKERCSGLIDLIPDEVSDTPALSILRLLAGEIKIADLEKEVAKAPQDWKAIAAISMYLRAVCDKAKIKELYTYCKKYQDEIIGLPKNDWAVVWNPRLVKWQSWFQSGKGEKEKLEKLIADNGAKPMKKLTEGDRKKRFKAVSDVIRLYLQNDTAKAKEAAVKEKTTYSGNYAKLYVLLDYLSGNNMVTTEKLFEATKTNASIWALATVAMFVKSLSDSEVPKKQQLFYYIDNYDGNYQFLKTIPEVSVWKTSVDRWRKWCDSGCRADAVDGLEPLLLAKSIKGKKAVVKAKVKDITTVKLDEFMAGRGERYEGRPKPASMDFDDNVFNAYLNSLPEKRRETEKLRYTTVKDIKPYIVRVLERSPYPKGLLTKRRKMRSGVVYMANENIVRYKKSTRAKKGKNYKWEDLAFEQYPAFMEYFAKRRLGISGAGQVTKKKLQKDAAVEYLGIAILCDWFGHYGDALKHAKRAVEICPEINERVSRMMLE